MVEIRKTEHFAKWLDGLRDIRARARILVRIERLSTGNPGDVRPVGEGVRQPGPPAQRRQVEPGGKALHR